MLVYHFLNAEYGLESIEKRRLKISRLNELNDPFEFFAINLADKPLRQALRKTKQELASKTGILCFSKDWHNPLLWGHYADKHKGICLAFEIPKRHLTPVTYVKGRLDDLSPEITEETMRQWISTKYHDWAYEGELRAFLSLNEPHEGTDLYFSNYSDDMSLRKIIIGCESTITRGQISAALGDGMKHVKRFKARAAFQDFRIVENKNPKLWR